MKIALAQIEVYAGQPARNAEKILTFIEQAKSQQADIVIFPANSISGALIGDTALKESFVRDCRFFHKKIIAASHGITIIFGSFNDVFVARDGKLIDDGEFKVQPNLFHLKIGGKTYKTICQVYSEIPI